MLHFFLYFYFFFQAEDGIRYYKVTGVQTCALPICRSESLGEHGVDRDAVGVRRLVERPDHAGGVELHAVEAVERRSYAGGRSEERRVGKECRSRWWWEGESRGRGAIVSWCQVANVE